LPSLNPLHDGTPCFIRRFPQEGLLHDLLKHLADSGSYVSMVLHDAIVTGSKYLDDLKRTPAMLIRGEENRIRTPELY
jgi:hypothetical protein